MKKEELFNIIGDVDEQKVATAGKAMNTQKKSRPSWLKWGTIAACLCVIISISVITLYKNDQDPPSAGAYLEVINVELVEWQRDGFKAIVVDPRNSSICPTGAELTVIFKENNTQIVTDDGSCYGYGEIQTSDIGWPVGSIIEVGFGAREKYDENRGYDNKVYAYHIELVSQ